MLPFLLGCAVGALVTAWRRSRPVLLGEVQPRPFTPRAPRASRARPEIVRRAPRRRAGGPPTP
jgi:hypothetical protein